MTFQEPLNHFIFVDCLQTNLFSSYILSYWGTDCAHWWS